MTLASMNCVFVKEEKNKKTKKEYHEQVHICKIELLTVYKYFTVSIVKNKKRF